MGVGYWRAMDDLSFCGTETKSQSGRLKYRNGPTLWSLTTSGRGRRLDERLDARFDGRCVQADYGLWQALSRPPMCWALDAHYIKSNCCHIILQ
jgi:hypothetical protein